MSNNAAFGALDESNEELGSSGVSADQVTDPSKRSAIIKTLPGPESPLVFKIVPQMRNGKREGYWPVASHTHLVGDCDPNNRKNYRSHLCQKMFNKPCPECDVGYANLDKIKALEKEGKKGNPEWNRLTEANKFLLPAQKGWVFLVLPDSPEVRAFKLPKDMINKLWGKAATKWKAAVESLTIKMAASGNDPYNLKSKTGWIRAYKVGEGMSTAYTVEEASTVQKVTLPDGTSVQAPVPASFSVNERILLTKSSELPNLGKYEERNIWSPEDSAYFAKNLRAPAHILAASAGTPEEDDPIGSMNGAAIPDVGLPDTSATDALLKPTPVAAPLDAVDSLL